MATIGLRGIWGLETLDRSGIETWKLGIALIAGGTVFGGGLAILMMSVSDQSAPDIQLNSFLVVLVFVFSGAMLFFALYFIRTTEADLHLLKSIDSDITESLGVLILNKNTFALFAVAGVALVNLQAHLPTIAADPSNAAAILLTKFSASFLSLILFYVLIPLYGVTIGVLAYTFYIEFRVLMDAANRVKIDLYMLRRYSAIANPLVRFVLAFLSILTVSGMLVFLDPLLTRSLLMGLLFFCLLSLIFLFLFGYPVVILRNRIKAEKETRLDEIEQRVEKLKSQNLMESGGAATIESALTHQMFIESRWEWPIESHVQKLVLFGLLPPVTWVLAAVIENIMY